MNRKPPAPTARLTMITLGVSNVRASIAFYEALGFTRKFRATGEAVAFFETGGTAIGLFPWDQLAQDVTLPERPRPQAFRGMTLAWNCRSTGEVDAVLELPLEALRAGRTRTQIERRGISFETDAYVVDEHLIWGATARILQDLLDRLQSPGPDGALSLAQPAS